MRKAAPIRPTNASRTTRRCALVRCDVRLIAMLVAPALMLGPASCSPHAAPSDQAKRVKVFVSIAPHAFFVERIAREHADVEVLVPTGQDPHTFEPTPKQVARLTSASVYFRAGMPFEWAMLRKIPAIGEDLEIVDTREGIDLLEIRHEHEDHRGGEEHVEEELDPHVWLSPRLAKVQCETICRTLVRIDPDHAEIYRRNLTKLQGELDALDGRIAKVLAPLKGKTFFVYHPAFGYFASAYGLEQKAVETGGKSPGPKHIRHLIDQARAQNVRVIFVSPQFSPRTAQSIAEQIGAAVVPMDPLPRDYIANMEAIADKIHRALR